VLVNVSVMVAGVDNGCEVSKKFGSHPVMQLRLAGACSILKKSDPIESIGFLLYLSVAVETVFETTC
jgi:hypothetical protein